MRGWLPGPVTICHTPQSPSKGKNKKRIGKERDRVGAGCLAGLGGPVAVGMPDGVSTQQRCQPSGSSSRRLVWVSMQTALISFPGGDLADLISVDRLNRSAVHEDGDAGWDRPSGE